MNFTPVRIKLLSSPSLLYLVWTHHSYTHTQVKGTDEVINSIINSPASNAVSFIHHYSHYILLVHQWYKHFSPLRVTKEWFRSDLEMMYFALLHFFHGVQVVLVYRQTQLVYHEVKTCQPAPSYADNYATYLFSQTVVHKRWKSVAEWLPKPH